MKHIVNLAVFFTSILLISGCDEIDPLKTPYKTSGTVIEVTGTQKVLIEDFTGFKCGNCPAAADKAKALSQSYPEKVILLAIHSGETFARPSGSKYKVDFRTSPGDELFNTFLGATGGQPNGMVNRATLGSSKIIAPDGWANEVANQLSKKAPASMDIVPTYNASTQELSVNVATTWIEEGNADQYLSVYLSEDSIVYWQKDYRKTPEDDSAYVHMHMLRAAIGNFGTWGESLGMQNPGSKVSKTYTISFQGKPWKPKDCHVVAILHNKTEGSIVLVDEKKVKM